MKRIYIAGPLNPHDGGGAIEYLNNCRQMFEVARKLIKLGFAPFCPALDLLFFVGGSPDDIPTDLEIKRYSLNWLFYCNAILMLPGWEKSSGAKNELIAATNVPLDIFYSLEELREKYGI